MSEDKKYDNVLNNITREEAIHILWFKSNLSYLLDSNQKEIYDTIKTTKEKVIVVAASRRLGKSWAMCVLAIEACLSQKNAIVKIVLPAQKDAKTIYRPLFREICADAPEELRPIEKSSAGLWYFPSTGSEILLAGSDNGRAESIRGGSANLCIVDEAGFADSLDYIVNSILIPTTTTTKGKIVLASTPSKSASHDFTKFVRQAEYNGTLIRKTIHDNKRLSKEDIDDLANAVGGYDSITFRREYLAQILTDESSAVIPEFTEELKAKIVQDVPRPPHFDGYVAMDLGIKDLTVVLFAYYDFKRSKLIIEDEFVINGQKFTTNALAEGIRLKESFVFTDSFTKETKEPYLRVSDNNLIVINDLYQLHGLNFLPTRKDDKDSALNNLRILLSDEKIIINPRCINLIRHLRDATWNKSRKSYDRSPDNGHYDAVDAIIYLVRNVQWNKNPYPAGYGSPSGQDSFRYNSKPAANENIKKIVNIK
jgi:phage terminase large subunit